MKVINLISKIMRNDYSLNLLNKFYTIFMGLFSSIFLTRYLGVILRGDYAVITQIVSILTIILNLGIHQSYSFFYKNSEDKDKLFKKYINIYSLQFLFYLLISIFLAFFIDNKLFVLSFLLVPSSILNIVMEATMAVENIRLKIKMHMVSVTIRALAFILMFYFIEQNIIVPILLTIFINILSSIIYLVSYRILPNILDIDYKFMLKIINYSWLPMIASLLMTLNYSVDIFILEYMGDPIELGLYSTAVSIINYIWLVPDSFKEVLVSRVTRTDSDEPTIFASKISFYAVLIIIICFILFGETAISIMYGKSFIDSYLVTVILSVGSVSMLYFKIIGVQLLAEGRRYFYFLSLLASVLLNVVLNYIFIPKYGMYGAAGASVVSYTVCGFLYLIYYVKLKNINIVKFYLFSKQEISDIKKIVRNENK